MRGYLIRAKRRITETELGEGRKEAILAGKLGMDITEEAAVGLDAKGWEESHLAKIRREGGIGRDTG